MNLKKTLGILWLVGLAVLVLGTGIFLYSAQKAYTIGADFTPVALNFDPDTNTSELSTPDLAITVTGGFVKGYLGLPDGTQTLVIRALSPLPQIRIRPLQSYTLTIDLENIDPKAYASTLKMDGVKATPVNANTLRLQLEAGTAELTLSPDPDRFITLAGKDTTIILGDNRDGYDTFQSIVDQVNPQPPAFVIDNGDLVFSGKANQYRLFDRISARFATTVLTTLGNHDIRAEGRKTYTLLYGPAYYSFDYREFHYVILDSSRGWAERTAIPQEQYAWLRRDLAKAAGKRIVVISHIPPRDPRSSTLPNTVGSLSIRAAQGESWVERQLDAYMSTKAMAHGFQDPAEAEYFETLMRDYGVETVYLSHIHSFFDTVKDGVRYIISGGAGAELLTENSIYHYLKAGFTRPTQILMVALPSPANTLIARYTATLALFAEALLRENPVSVSLILLGILTISLTGILRLYLARKRGFDAFILAIRDILVYAYQRLRKLFSKSPQ